MRRRNRVLFTNDEKEMLVLCALESLRNGSTLKQGVSDFLSSSKVKHSYASCYKKIQELKKESQYKAFFDELDGQSHRKTKQLSVGEDIVNLSVEKPSISIFLDSSLDSDDKTSDIMSSEQLSEWLGKIEHVVSNYSVLLSKLEETRDMNKTLLSENEELVNKLAEVTKDRDDILSVFVRARNLISEMPQQKDDRVVTVDRNLIVQSVTPAE